MSERGFPVTKEQLLDSVQLLIKQLQKEDPFMNNRSGCHWYELFIRQLELCTSSCTEFNDSEH